MTLELRPSGAHRWVRCNAYPSFASQLPVPPENDAAKEGTCAAWVAEVVLTGDAHSCEDMYGETCPANGWLVDEDMVHHVQGYVDMIQKRGNGHVNAEQHIVISESNPRLAGTLDSSTDMIVDGLLYVDDLKYGQRIVEVRGNEQLIIYAWGKMMKLPAGTVRLIQLSIYQPRAFHPDGIYRKWVISPEELRAEMVRIWNQALKCNAPDPLATPGTHCRDCPAASQCVALAHSTYAMVDTIQSSRLKKMSAEELSKELEYLEVADKVVKARVKAVRSEAEQRVANEQIPGWSMQPHYGNRDWKVDAFTIAARTGKNPYADQKLATPLELERRGASEHVVDELTHKKFIGHKLTRFTAKDVAAVFEQKKME